jgi:predicted XRE-type DNA-binding protein
MSNEQFTSVWDAIEDSPVAAENMKLRSELMMALKEYIDASRLSQTQAAKLFGITQPRVSDLVRGRIDLFSLDALVNMASSAGMLIDIRIRQAA